MILNDTRYSYIPFFVIEAAVLLSFIWVVDWILRKAAEETKIGYILVVGSPRTKIHNVAFAGDVLLVTNIIEVAQILLLLKSMLNRWIYS